MSNANICGRFHFSKMVEKSWIRRLCIVEVMK